MGVPGDHIRVVDKVVYLNGKPLQEPYAQHIFPNPDPYRDNFPSELPATQGPLCERRRADDSRAHDARSSGEELVVPPDSYFAMGDNRDNSLDSRYWGFVPRENIIGKPLLIFWSYDAPTADLVGYQRRSLHRSRQELLLQDPLGSGAEAGPRLPRPVTSWNMFTV